MSEVKVGDLVTVMEGEHAGKSGVVIKTENTDVYIQPGLRDVPEMISGSFIVVDANHLCEYDDEIHEDEVA